VADIQRQFMQFDEAIRLKHFDENATLRENVVSTHETRVS